MIRVEGRTSQGRKKAPAIVSVHHPKSSFRNRRLALKVKEKGKKKEKGLVSFHLFIVTVH